jgi:TPR repeat protein
MLHYFLGNVYRDGVYVDKDINKAEKEYRKSISYGGHIAYNALFYLFFYDDYGCKNLRKADEVINEGFKKYPEQLIFAYCNNLFEYKKYKEMIEIISKYNAEEECAEYLGTLYYNGLGVPQDFKKAFNLFNRAYKNSPSSTSVMFRLGRCYFFGQGVNEDKVLAKELMYKSKSGQYKDAEKFWKEWIEK